MTAREWLSATWAEWRPTITSRRFEFGPLIIMTRRGLRDVFMEGKATGRHWEQKGIHPDRPTPPTQTLHSA